MSEYFKWQRPLISQGFLGNSSCYSGLQTNASPVLDHSLAQQGSGRLSSRCIVKKSPGALAELLSVSMGASLLPKTRLLHPFCRCELKLLRSDVTSPWILTLRITLRYLKDIQHYTITRVGSRFGSSWPQIRVEECWRSASDFKFFPHDCGVAYSTYVHNILWRSMCLYLGIIFMLIRHGAASQQQGLDLWSAVDGRWNHYDWGSLKFTHNIVYQ